MTTIQTFPQWDKAKRRSISQQYSVTLTELADLYKPDYYRRDWWTETLKAYTDGAAFTTAQWNKLTEWEQYTVLRSPRALHMDGGTRDPWKIAA